jgi:MFS family permease
MPPPQVETSSSRQGTFRSLQARNYRLYFLGQLASLCGTWMQGVALAWLVLDLTDSGAQVGVVTSLQFLPLLLLGPASGVLIDRSDRRKVLLAAEVFLGVQALVLTLLVVSGAVHMWMLYVLAAAQGVGTSVEQPGRQALLSELVPDDDLPNAVSLNAALFTMSRVVGPALAGVLITTAGVEVCFSINALSFLGIIAALLAMRASELHHRPQVVKARGQLREGVATVARSPLVRPLFLSTAVLGLFGQQVNVVLPIMAKDVFGGGAGTYSAMATITALGSCVAAFGLAAAAPPSDRRIMAMALLLGVSLVGCAVAPVLAAELAVLPLMGFAQLAANVSTNAAVQLRTPPALRGRVIALYFATGAGAQALGSTVIGAVVDGFGTRAALAIAGGITVVVGLGWAVVLRRRSATPLAPVAPAG